MKKQSRQWVFYVTLFYGVALAYLIWLLWSKLTELIGDDWKVIIILLVIVGIGIISGHYTFKKVLERFK